MTDSAPPSSHRAKAVLAWMSLVLLPVLGAFLRYRGHSAHAYDPETSLAATAAREWVHGRLGFLPHYHFNLHQGSQIVDALLAMPGIWLFGDHTMSWAVVALFWVAVTAGAGAFVLHRLVNPQAAWVWAVLLALAPFLIKDGMLAHSGGHPPVAGQVLAALAFAVVARRAEGRRAWVFAFLAGAVVGGGTWYTRSVVVAGPCIAVALWPVPGRGTVMDELLRGLRSRQLWAGFAGTLLFPALLIVTFAMHHAAETRSSTDENFAGRLINPIVDMESCTAVEISQGLCEEGESRFERLGNKTAEMLGLRHGQTMWMQPRSLETGFRREEWKPFRNVGGAVWQLALLLSLPLLLVGIRSGRVSGPASLILFAAVVYLALYVLTSMRIEDEVAGFWTEVIEPPAPTTIRYLIPAWLLLLAVLSAGIGGGVQATGPLKAVSWTLLGALVVTGAALTGRDLVLDGDPSLAFERHQSFRYFRNYVHGRGPPQEAHRICDVEEPISRANHLRSWSTFNWCDMTCLMHDFTETDDEFRWLVAQAGEACGQPISGEDQAFVAHGLGVLFGSQARFYSYEDIAITVLRAFGAGENLEEVDARWFFLGVQDALWDYGDTMQEDEAIELLCRETKWGTRPLCPLVGVRFCEWESPSPPASPMNLCTNIEGFLERLPPEILPGVVQGVGRSTGHKFAPIQPSEHDWSGWDPALKDAFLEGWATGGRWRWRADTVEYRPDRIP
ncbi:MAG: hypothetical protein KDA24_15670 [Deltaproteobacteria bacterium]|nr:hypothetical protein [Deltaproteobacteria bacterium]